MHMRKLNNFTFKMLEYYFCYTVEIVYTAADYLWYKIKMPPKKRKLTFDLDGMEKISEEMQRAILELNKALNIQSHKLSGFRGVSEFCHHQMWI